MTNALNGTLTALTGAAFHPIGQPNEQGGNWQVFEQSQPMTYTAASDLANYILNSGGLIGPQSRYGGVPSLHAEGATLVPQLGGLYAVRVDAHVDGINPNYAAPLGTLAHGGYDVVLGNLAQLSGYSLGCH